MVAVPYTHYWRAYKRLMGHWRHYARQSLDDLLASNGFVTEDFLPNFPNYHQSFTRRYVLVRTQAMTFGRLMGCKSVFDFKWPWRTETALKRLEERLAPRRKADAALPYAELETSTFIAARTAQVTAPMLKPDRPT